MHSAQHYRQRAAQVRRLRESVLDPALLKQLETVANEYDPNRRSYRQVASN